MIGRLKTYALIVLGGLALVLNALRGRAVRARDQQRANAAEAAREYERAGSDAMVRGLEREQEVQRADVDVTSRDHFE